MNRPRYADVVGTVALVLALGGTAAYAAQSLPKHSVGKRQLKSDAVTSTKIRDSAVKSADLAANSVTEAELRDNAVTTRKIANNTVTQIDMAAGSVGSAELGNGAVNGAKVANNSLSLDDLVGADVNTTATYSLTPGSCTDLTLSVPGATAGQAGLLSLTGAVDPGEVVFRPLRVGANSAATRVCNVGGTPVTTTNLGVRVVTFG